MSPGIRLAPGRRLLVRAQFLAGGALFFGLYGPVSVTFSSLWPSTAREIRNPGPHLWQFFPHASQHGPLGSEVPVSLLQESDVRTVFAAGDPASPDALLIVDLLAA